MLKPSFDRDAMRFFKKLPNKHGKQISLKIVDLCCNPYLHDSKKLKGKLAEYHRADIGEYRIIYFVMEDMLRIPLIRKRNDNAVYRQIQRKMK